MQSECFHKLSSFSNATNGLGGSVRGRKRHPGSQGCVVAGPQRGENKLAPVSATVMSYHPFGSPGKFLLHTWTTWTIGGMLETTAPSVCSWCTQRESKEWHRVEFQIFKAIFHFPPREGIHAFAIFKASFISKVQLTGAMVTFKQA